MRNIFVPLLLPAILALVVLIVQGTPGSTFAAAVVTLAGFVIAIVASRDSIRRQLQALIRTTRGHLEGAPAVRSAEEEDTLDEVTNLESAIHALHAQLAAQNAQLTQEARTLTAVLDGMIEGIWITDAEGTVTRHNDALREMLQPSNAGIIGQRPLALIRNEELNTAVMRACREGASSSLELTLEGLFPRTLAIRVTPLGKDLPGSAAVFNDVTELRRLEKVRKDFVANVSHELRTPITAIRGYAETLQSGALTDSAVAPKMVEIIHRQSQRLSELVEDLLELSRLESREVQLKIANVPLSVATSRAAETVRPKAASKNIHLELHVPPELVARGDERAVEQVLLNLLDNAVKYSPEGGRVDVQGAWEDGRCVVRVKDTGVGIEPKHLSRIFERFYRVDKGRSRDMGGTGLGLSIVKHLVGAMEGEVKVESQPHVGSVFAIFLPVAAPEAASG